MFGIRPQQDVDALLWMNPSQKQPKRSITERRREFAPAGTLACLCGIRPRRAISDDAFGARVRSERLPSEPSLFIAGEKYRRRVTQHMAFTQLPIDPLLDVLKWIRATEPWIEHAVRKNKVRR